MAKLTACLCYCAKKHIYEETNRSVMFLRTHCIPPWRKAPSGSGPPRYRGFTITLRHTTLGTTPLDEWPARRRDNLTTHSTHNRQTSMPPAGFEPTTPASERSQTHTLDRTATGIGCKVHIRKYITGMTKMRLEHGTGVVRASCL